MIEKFEKRGIECEVFRRMSIFSTIGSGLCWDIYLCFSPLSMLPSDTQCFWFEIQDPNSLFVSYVYCLFLMPCYPKNFFATHKLPMTAISFNKILNISDLPIAFAMVKKFKLLLWLMVSFVQINLPSHNGRLRVFNLKRMLPIVLGISVCMLTHFLIFTCSSFFL